MKSGLSKKGGRSAYWIINYWFYIIIVSSIILISGLMKESKIEKKLKGS